MTELFDEAIKTLTDMGWEFSKSDYIGWRKGSHAVSVGWVYQHAKDGDLKEHLEYIDKQIEREADA